jgi:hypothetical protein
MRLGELASAFTRELRDQAVVDGNLPAATRHLTVEGVRGWLYPVLSELGDSFQLFAFFDGSAYQVKVVEPAVEERFDPHACHLFPDGRICFGGQDGGGMPSLEAAFAKSVVWSNGFSVYLRTSRFPF